MQVNIAGFSLRSISSLDRYINDNSIHLVAVSESHGRMLGFKNYDVYKSRVQTNGWVLLVNNHLKSYEVTERVFGYLYVVFVFIKSRDTEFLVGSIYAGLSDVLWVFMNLISFFKILRCKNQLKGPVVPGNFNARHTAWGDTTSNGCGKFIYLFSVMRALLCHLPTKLHLVKAMSMVEVLLTSAWAGLQCAIYSLMHWLLRRSNSLLVRLPLVIGQSVMNGTSPNL